MSRWDLPLPESPIRQSSRPFLTHSQVARGVDDRSVDVPVGLEVEGPQRILPWELRRLDAPVRSGGGPVVALGHQRFGEEPAIGHLVPGGCFGQFGELGPEVGSLSMRHACSTAAAAACSVSPRWRLSVTASLPWQRGGRPPAWLSAAGRRPRSEAAAGCRPAAAPAAVRSGRSRSSVPAPRGQQEPRPRRLRPPSRPPGRQRLRSERSPQSGGKSGDQVFVRDVAAHQQDLDQCPGGVPLAMGSLRRLPPGVMDGVNFPAERACSRAVAPGNAPDLRTRASR